MKRQKRKQEKLILKMLPKVIVEKVIKGGEPVAETFDQATLYFSSVDGFTEVSKNCKYVFYCLIMLRVICFNYRIQIMIF